MVRHYNHCINDKWMLQHDVFDYRTQKNNIVGITKKFTPVMSNNRKKIAATRCPSVPAGITYYTITIKIVGCR
jgi:hypothetical protein